MMLQLKPNLDKERDPMAGIMDLMKVRFKLNGITCLVHLYILYLSHLHSICSPVPIRTSAIHLQNMYEEGDDEMKKTIAKAWTDARSGKAADPLQSYRWTFVTMYPSYNMAGSIWSCLKDCMFLVHAFSMNLVFENGWA